MNVTPFYAAILSLLFFVLSVRAIRLRRELKTPIGDGNNPRMQRVTGVHSNFAEYVPLTLLLVFMLELQEAHHFLLHTFCTCLLTGRVSHAYGVSKEPENYRYRVFGMAMTFTALLGAATSLLVSSVARVFA